MFPNKKGFLAFGLAFLYGRLRFFWFVRILRLKLNKNSKVSQETAALDYSKSAFQSYGPDTRIFWPLFLLSSIPDLEKESLLILGPRFETEILLARSMGFKNDGIKAIDTFSYSPLVDIGDMHDLPYENGQFQGIICGWTISYSTNPILAAAEMTRVLAPGGYIVLAVQKVEDSFIETIPGILPTTKRIQTLKQFDELFILLERVAGFEPAMISSSSHTLVAYKKSV
jgi:hypothetical protein